MSKEEEDRTALELIPGVEFLGEDVLAIYILPNDVYDIEDAPKVVSLGYDNARNESGIYSLPYADRAAEMERRGYSAPKLVWMQIPASFKSGFWQPPETIRLNLDYPVVWVKDGEIWLDVEGLTC